LTFDSDDIYPPYVGYYNGKITSASYCNMPQPIKGAVFYSVSVSPQLSLTIYPMTGGNVVGDKISCDITTLGICQYHISKDTQRILTATPSSSSYVFSHWQNGEVQTTDNPYVLDMDTDKKITAVFAPVFSFPLNGSTQNVFNYPVSLPRIVPFTEAGVVYDKYAMIHNQLGIYYAIYAASTSRLPHVYGYSGNMRVIFNASMLGNVMVYRIDKNQYNATWLNYTTSMLTNGSGVSVATGDDCAINPMFYTNSDLVFSSDDIYPTFLGYYNGKITSASYCNMPQPTNNAMFYGATKFTQLNITVEPLEGGGVTGNGISCNIDTCGICEYYPIQNAGLTLTAQPKAGYAFSHWEIGGVTSQLNPYTGVMSGDKAVKAVFNKTFRNAVDCFGKEIGDTGGWCTNYVNYETGITKASGEPFSGDAYEYFQEAIDEGYATGSEPRVGAIVVFNNTSLPYGHVGIVKEIHSDTNSITIRESNWCDPYCYRIGEHNEDISDPNIRGYIYYAP
jgi:hypothetical protein